MPLISNPTHALVTPVWVMTWSQQMPNYLFCSVSGAVVSAAAATAAAAVDGDASFYSSK